MRRRLVLGLVLLAALALVATGCGTSRPYGGEEVTPTPTADDGSAGKPGQQPVTVPVEYQNGDAVAGKTVFTTQSCFGCHTLSDAGATGNVGPNLDTAKPDLGLVVERVTKGRGAMPPFEGTLTDKQIADVAAYVVEATS
jgi:mono/diheme cytochrome c family protein